MAVDAGNAALADGYDWTTVRHVADIGGGTGTLIAEVLRRNPRLRGTLADLPETAARARQYLAGLGLDGRCEVVGQSFFDPLPPGRTPTCSTASSMTGTTPRRPRSCAAAPKRRAAPAGCW